MQTARGRFAGTLITLEAALALCAFGGAAYLVLRPHDAMPADLLARTPFGSWVWPGLVLALAVAVPAAATALGGVLRRAWAHVAHPLVGLVLVGWIVVQVAVIGFVAGLQPIMAVCGLVIAVLGWLNYRAWHCGWGATDGEHFAAMPGDDLIARPHFAPTRAISIAARPERVWPWIVQLGYGRAGWYSYDWLDNKGRPSAHRILPDLQEPAIGAKVPMSRWTAFRVRRAIAPRVLVWAKPDSTWAWILKPTPSGGTRLVTRVRARYAGWDGLIGAPLMELGDFPMMRKCLLGIKQRAEAAAQPSDQTAPEDGRPS
jgi:hypothetical protein